ncbi:MAG: anthranilate phosphoribosyltransferase [Corynebacterium sp.]|nr:anthranilate phosphoribosyltransferase [Corynebacterium sp.]
MNQELQERFAAFLDNQQPSIAEVREVFEPLSAGEFDEIHIAALLTAIRTRGETAADITGAAQAFLEVARPFPLPGSGVLDTAGTGGDGANTINITTGASLLAAAAGARTVKCGNRSVSSSSGSADVLEALGIAIDLAPEVAAQQVAEHNFTFLFAPLFHPATAHVQPVRRALKVSTLFNTLGPILSPVRPEFQIMGIANPHQGELIINTFRDLGRTHALVVHGSGTDEIALHGSTIVWELNKNEITRHELQPSDFGVAHFELSELAGAGATENATAITNVLRGEGQPAHIAALTATAGAMLYVSNIAESFAAGTAKAQETIDNGQAATWLAAIQES